MQRDWFVKIRLPAKKRSLAKESGKLKTPPSSPNIQPKTQPKINIDSTTKRKKRPRIPSDGTDTSEKKRPPTPDVVLSKVKKGVELGKLVEEREIIEFINNSSDFNFVQTPKDGNCFFSVYDEYFQRMQKYQKEINDKKTQVYMQFYNRYGDVQEEINKRFNGVAFRLFLKDKIKANINNILNDNIQIVTKYAIQELQAIKKIEDVVETNCITDAWGSNDVSLLMLYLFPDMFKKAYILIEDTTYGGYYWECLSIEKENNKKIPVTVKKQQNSIVSTENAIFSILYSNHFALLFPKRDMDKVKLEIFPGATVLSADANLGKSIRTLKLLKL